MVKQTQQNFGNVSHGTAETEYINQKKASHKCSEGVQCHEGTEIQQARENMLVTLLIYKQTEVANKGAVTESSIQCQPRLYSKPHYGSHQQ